MKYTKESILQICEEEDVEFIRMQFTNSQGIMKNIAITSSQLEKALNNEVLFDSSSVDGFYQPEAAEIYLYPDLDTFTIFPWRPQQGKVARLICDVMKQDGSPYEGDPRGALKRAIAHAKELGYTFRVGPELEFSFSTPMKMPFQLPLPMRRLVILTLHLWTLVRTPDVTLF